MAAAILQQAAGGALMGASSPAAADLACRAAVMAAPRLLGLMQRNYHSSAPRAPLHRPAAAAIASGSRGLSSYDKYASQLKDEEEEMRTKKQLAVALMNDTPRSSGDGDHGEEVKSVSNLLSLLGAPAPAPTNGPTADQLAKQLLNERRSLLEKKKNALLIELLNGDGHGRDHKTAEVVAAARQLLDDLAAYEERRAHKTFSAELKGLQKMVEANRLKAEADNRSAMSSMDLVKAQVQSTNATVHSYRADVKRLEAGVAEARLEAKMAGEIVDSVKKIVETLQGSYADLSKSTESAKNLSCFVFWCGALSGLSYYMNYYL
ncbi:hypothetical protein VPH35_050009 [Triticum aestivum]|nr:uncharacterized protein LOC123064855 [Triticum aestivum]